MVNTNFFVTYKLSHNYEHILTILLKSSLEISLLSLSIIIVYFTYGKLVEGQAVKNQSIYLANNLASDFIPFLSSTDRSSIKSSLISSQKDTNIHEDSIVTFNNSIIENNAYKLFGIIFSVIISVVFILCFFTRIQFLPILLESTFITIIVASVEILFLTYIGSKFIVVDTSEVKSRILHDISK